MKNNPKKIMEIIYIFILPVLFMLPLVSITKTERIISETQTITEKTIDYYSLSITKMENPIEIIFDYIGEAMNIQTDSIIIHIVIDYITLWFIMFVTWHLLYLFFDTLMHKVLLRKE